MVEVFPNTQGFDTLTPFMVKRILLEFAMIKQVINQNYEVELDEILHDAGISVKDPRLKELLESVAQNNVVSFHHQDLFTNMINQTTHLNSFIDCNPFIVNKWTKKLGYNNTYTLNRVSQAHRDAMIKEIDLKIGRMKGLLS